MRAVTLRRWDIFCSVILRRDPLIAPLMSEIEKRYQHVQLLEEQEKSLLCDFELKARKDKKLLEKRAALEREGKELSELDGELGVTSSMMIDEWSKKAKTYDFDAQNLLKYNEKNIWRDLDKKLFLVVKQSFGKENYASPWILPQEQNIDGESLKQTASRCVARILGESNEVTLAGNAPFASFSHSYPKPVRTQTSSHGAKIFFYNAKLSPTWNDSVVKNNVLQNYKWMTVDEFWKTVPGKQYKMSIRTALFE